MSDEQGAIPEGMVAWHGGDSAPADWDFGPVLGDDGEFYECDEDGGLVWRHGLSARGVGADIIAYTPAADRLTDTGEGDGQTLVDLLRRASVESDRSEADVLDRVRLSIGKDDTDAWNALLYAAMHLRLEADRTERKRVLATPKPPVDAGAMQRYRHKARGTEYDLIGTAELQDASGAKVEEGALLAIYRGEDGKLWARRHTEFGDGRFERIRNLSDDGEAM